LEKYASTQRSLAVAVGSAELKSSDTHPNAKWAVLLTATGPGTPPSPLGKVKMRLRLILMVRQ
jgi:hypothetical protein